ncbi:MAG: hypothetical protein QME81_16095 [bacterium]|nr:hypothetical protein [bacterium]
MKIVPSPRFLKQMAKYDKKFREKVYKKLDLFVRNKNHPSLRYKSVVALKNEYLPVKEISITMNIRITLQEAKDHIYLRNIGGHNILP